MDDQNKKWWMIALGAVLVGAVVFLFWGFDGKDESIGKPKEAVAGGRERLSAMGRPQGSPPSRQKVTIEPAESVEMKFDPYEEWETARIVEHFGIPSAKFEGETMAEVVAMIRAMYEEYGGRNVEFEIVGGVDAGYPVVADIDENVSLRVLLDLVAGLGGYDLELSEGLVTFRRKQTAADDGQLQTVRLPIVPGMEEERVVVDDPFADPAEPMLLASPMEWFSKYGIQFTEGAEALADEEAGVLELTNVGAELARARAVHKFAIEKIPGSLPGGTVHFSFKNVGGKGGADFEAQTFADASGFDAVMRDLGESMEVRSAPVIFVNAGQRAKIEMGREVVYTTGTAEPGGAPNYEMRMVGYMAEVETRVAGLDRVLVTGSSEYTTLGETGLDGLLPPAGGGSEWLIPRQDVNEEDFRSHMTDFDGEVLDGNTVGFSVAKDSSADMLQFFTARRVLPDGNPLLPE